MVLDEYVSWNIRPLPHKPISPVKLMPEISTDPVSFPGISSGPTSSVKSIMLHVYSSDF